MSPFCLVSASQNSWRQIFRSFFLLLSSPLIPEKMYGISVPGFAATVPDRIHTGPEKTDNKLEAGLEALAQSKEGKEAKEGKRKAVAPRAARLLKPREED